MPTKYRRIPSPGKPPTREELKTYMARIAESGQIDHYGFSSGLMPMLIIGAAFLLVGAGLILWAVSI